MKTNPADKNASPAQTGHAARMSINQENFITDLMAQTKSHEQWITVVQFGMGTLLKQQGLLSEVIFCEASREAKKAPHHKPSDEVAKILHELGLKLTLA